MDASDVNDLLIFRAVAAAGSFVAGGRAMGLSRSAAGKAMARLEARYGVRLFNRSTRAIQLTQEGARLLEHADAIRSVLDSAEAAMAPDTTRPSGVLRLTVPDAFGRRVLLPVVQDFLARWPDVEVELGLSDRVVNIIEEGFDLAIRLGVTDPPAGLIARTLLRDRVFLVASPAYVGRVGTPDRVEQLSRHEILFSGGQGGRQAWRLQEDGVLLRAQGRSRLRLDSGEALRQACLSGMGIAMLPAFLVADDIAAGALVGILPEVEVPPVPVVALYPHRRFLEPRVRAFIDFLIDRLPAPNAR